MGQRIVKLNASELAAALGLPADVRVLRAHADFSAAPDVEVKLLVDSAAWPAIHRSMAIPEMRAGAAPAPDGGAC